MTINQTRTMFKNIIKKKNNNNNDKSNWETLTYVR